MVKVMVPIFEGFEEIEAFTIIDVLRRAGINVEIVGLGGMIIQSGQGVKVYADKRFIDIDDKYDAIVIPGGPGYRNLILNQSFLSFLEKFGKQGKLIGAICAAPLALAKVNLLMDKRATCYPGLEKNLDMPRDDPVVVDGNIVTSQGPGTALKFALKLVEILVGPQKAAQLKDALLA
ncbi:MAG: DJ-1/PfpI family protein [Candidatus Aenigmarchaeota archaeon]|nr:DJ-1/PfpI family protein [Candidatus Aenigmarchaeota archaeon]